MARRARPSTSSSAPTSANLTCYEADIILIDIIGFSKLESVEQHELITSFTENYKQMIQSVIAESKIKFEDLIGGFISTGDGFYSILAPSLKGYGVIFALSLKSFSDVALKKHTYFKGVRIAVHTGEVHPFHDILGHMNFVGDALNECARYLDQKRFDISHVVVSDTAFESFRLFLDKFPKYAEVLRDHGFRSGNAFEFEDKHHYIYVGYVVWIRKNGIINPPKVR